ncbi:MAG: sulfotransferase [Albidovulum sp.]
MRKSTEAFLDMPDSKQVQPIYFVGGAPRSGTTVTHALICTSERVSNYHPEISFIRPTFEAYAQGNINWAAHTNAFFAERAHFRHHMHDIVMRQLNHVALTLNNPEILCVKDPLLSQRFYWVNDLLREKARFVTVIRNPHKVVRSRQAVAEKMGRTFAMGDVERVAQEFNRSYAHIDLPQMAGTLLCFRYEDLMTDKALESLRSFIGTADIDPDRIWSGKKSATKVDASDPWFSPKYNQSIDTRDRLGPLSPEFSAVVDKICKPLMTRFDYQNGG